MDAQVQASNKRVELGPTRIESMFSLRKLGELKFEGTKPLTKPSMNARGVFGGNLCGQGIVAAMETVPQGFTPHSLHSYFIKAGEDKLACQYDVEKLTDGRNFANRLVRVSQEGQLRYIMMISLTKKNSMDQAAIEHGKDPKKSAPFEYQAPVSTHFHQYGPESLPVKMADYTKTLQHKIPPVFVDKHRDPVEMHKRAGERDLSFWIRVDDLFKDQKYKYAGFGVASDSLFLTSLSRILHLPVSDPDGVGISGGKGDHFFSVSLDHTIYFHDDDFDPSDWSFFNFKAPRFANNRVMFQGSFYNREGKMFASIVQEGLVFFHGGHERMAKL